MPLEARGVACNMDKICLVLVGNPAFVWVRNVCMAHVVL